MKDASIEATLTLLIELGQAMSKDTDNLVTYDKEAGTISSPIIDLMEELTPKELGYIFYSLQNLSALLPWLNYKTKGGETRTAVHSACIIQDWLKIGAISFIKHNIIENIDNPKDLYLSIICSAIQSPTLTKYEDEYRKLEEAKRIENMLKDFHTDIIN
jgi:hypothetical protein